jgi:hypothetical protein
MRTKIEIVILWVVLCPLLVPLRMGAQTGTPLGVLLEIRSPAYITETTGGSPNPLDPRRDIMRKLYAGQSLRAGPGGKLKLGLSKGIQEVRPSETWFVIRQEASLTPEQMKVDQALRRYGTPGGSRAMGSPLFSPADGSTVRSRQMVIRWNPPPQSGKVGFRLESVDGQKLWSQGNVEAGAGKLESASLAKALAEYRSGGGEETLILVMIDTEGNESQVSFSVLSPSGEQELEKDLARWNQFPDPLLRSIGRAYEYGRRRLLAECAAEYEAALVAAPESHDLLSSAVEAHRRAGNYGRAAELRKRLTPAQKVP